VATLDAGAERSVSSTKIRTDGLTADLEGFNERENEDEERVKHSGLLVADCCREGRLYCFSTPIPSQYSYRIQASVTMD
jgi:hypothetical protein